MEKYYSPKKILVDDLVNIATILLTGKYKVEDLYDYSAYSALIDKIIEHYNVKKGTPGNRISPNVLKTNLQFSTIGTVSNVTTWYEALRIEHINKWLKSFYSPHTNAGAPGSITGESFPVLQILSLINPNAVNIIGLSNKEKEYLEEDFSKILPPQEKKKSLPPEENTSQQYTPQNKVKLNNNYLSKEEVVEKTPIILTQIPLIPVPKILEKSTEKKRELTNNRSESQSSVTIPQPQKIVLNWSTISDILSKHGVLSEVQDTIQKKIQEDTEAQARIKRSPLKIDEWKTALTEKEVKDALSFVRIRLPNKSESIKPILDDLQITTVVRSK